MKAVTVKRTLRSRLVVVLSASVAAVGIIGGLASASGENQTIHGCINKGSGALRVVAGPAQCSPAETAISWTTGADAELADGSVTTAKLRDASNDPTAPTGVITSKIENGAVTSDKLAGGIPGSYIESITGEQVTGYIAASQVNGALANATIAANALTGSITDSQITSLSTSKLTGSIASGQIASLDADKLTGTLDVARIAANSLTGTQLALASDKDFDPGTSPTGVENRHIEPGTIEGDRLAPEGVGTAQLAPAAVTTSRQTANAASGSGLINSLQSGEWADAVITHLSLADATPHQILLTGQVNVLCDCSNATAGDVSYQIIRKRDDGTGEVLLGPAYAVTVDHGDRMVLPVSVIDRVGSGSWRYVLRVAVEPGGIIDPEEVLLYSPMLNAVDLGRG